MDGMEPCEGRATATEEAEQFLQRQQGYKKQSREKRHEHK
jgi:hypothetical protein